MARPVKEGLDYFPLDVDFFDDPKILLVEEKFGLIGPVVASRILCWIYREGYYVKWDHGSALVMAKKIGNGVTHEQINAIIDDLMNSDFLDKALYISKGVLTSRGIQKRWIEVVEKCKRKAKIDSELSLVNTEETKAKNEETPPEPEGTTQRKEKHLLYKAVAEIFGRDFELDPEQRMPALYGWYNEIQIQSGKLIEAYGAVKATRQVKGYIKHCKDTKRKMIGLPYKAAETILQSDWEKLVAMEPDKPAAKYTEAAYNKTLWTEDAWLEYYKKHIKTDPGFRKHFQITHT